ncbi:PPE family protein [Mycobacterium tuberculosis]
MSGWEGEWVMEFPVLPPEINSVLMYSGAGSSPLLAAAAAWDGLAEELGSAAVSFGQVTSGLTAGVWQGAAAAAMAAAAAPYAGWLGSVAAAAEAVAGQARVVVGVFEAALAATVDPALVAANRARLVALAVSNLLGAEHAGDRGRRGRVRADVGRRCGGDGRLPFRRVGCCRGVAGVQPTGAGAGGEVSARSLPPCSPALRRR